VLVGDVRRQVMSHLSHTTVTVEIHLLDTLDSELLNFEGDLVAVWREEVGKVQDILGERGGEEDNLSGLGHLLLDTLALVTHALQICIIYVRVTRSKH
jgi:hypothetical protein